MTERQKEYLKLIIKSYIEDGQPVGSSYLIKKYKLPVSSATVRNEMNSLENLGFLEKQHTSGGRIPSTKGYEIYAKELVDDSDDRMQEKLKDIFAKRRLSIDLTLDQAAKAISEMAGLTLVTTSTENDELLKSIQLTPLNDIAATIVMVTSSGRVESKLIEINSFIEINDVRIAIRLFKERLIDTKLRDIPKKVEALAPLLSDSVKNYEQLIQTFIGKVFDFHNRVTNKIYGNNELIKSNIDREEVANLMTLIEEKSVWSSIEGQLDEDQNMKIEIRPNNTSIITKRISTKNTSKEISVIGSNRMNYSDAKKALEILEKLIKGE